MGRRIHPRRRFLLAGLILAGRCLVADTRPPVDMPTLHEAQAQDAAIAAIDAQIRRGEWQPARDAAGALLVSSKSVWHGALQRALVRLAFLEAKLGQDDEALWHWQALQAMGGALLAEPFFPLFGAEGENLKIRAAQLGDQGIPNAGEEAGATVGLIPARRTGGVVPPGNSGCTAARGPLWARFQAVIDARGGSSQPRIVGPSVCFSFEVLKAARAWTFEPARRNGTAVAATYTEAINPPAARAFRELASGGAAVTEALALLESGDFPSAERLLDRQWNADLDAGSPSRSHTVTVMALRALALAAHDDPGDRRRAACLFEAAQGEDPAFYHVDLSSFGEAGRRLEPHRFGEARSAPLEESSAAARIDRPRVRRETRRVPRERFPGGSYGASRVSIEAIVDAEGSVRDPILFDGREGMRGLDLDSLDAVCSWRFEPAKIGGKPIALLYVLSLDVAGGRKASP
jgi:hypothetical protein